ncbi:LytR C-terminal domain-containing protein [Actinoplanes sp. NPDC049599]|uniref:LytR C-terminal domain-containing protein n=1 Tax=Actinoplanes sp. NPDC049599 TaxID=3363903 RepID=UPI0037B02877
MSHPVRERLAELAVDVDQVRLAPAADVRARGRTRARRRRAGTAVALVTVVAAAGFGLASVTGRTPEPVATPPAGPRVSCRFPVDLNLPHTPGELDVQVYAAALQAGAVTAELDRRGFTATGHSLIDRETGTVGTVAVIRYGPRAIGAAGLVRALVGGDAVMQFSPDRDGRAVDLVLGTEFQRLATSTEMNTALLAAARPTAPPGC